MKLRNSGLPLIVAALVACAPSAAPGSGTNAPARGVLRVTNYTREAVQVFQMAGGNESYLRLIGPGNSESFQLETHLLARLFT